MTSHFSLTLPIQASKQWIHKKCNPNVSCLYNRIYGYNSPLMLGSRRIFTTSSFFRRLWSSLISLTVCFWAWFGYLSRNETMYFPLIFLSHGFLLLQQLAIRFCRLSSAAKSLNLWPDSGPGLLKPANSKKNGKIKKTTFCDLVGKTANFFFI